ncbi:MAG TPA: ATP-binding protein [Thermoanaerobaculia bacterium]|nr:ATP-binding protein [Thermoanaerobaculia bacterium]HQP86736.1 ATP-binding protein [Thermoanaerobaculia bacterium]
MAPSDPDPGARDGRGGRTMRGPRRLSQKLILSLTVVVSLVVVANGVIAVRSAETQLQATMLQSVEQLSGAIASSTWHAMLADQRDAAYEVMQTIAAKQGIRSVRIFNKEGRVMFSTPRSEVKVVDKKAEACFLCHASEQPLVRVDAPTRARVVHRPGGGRTLAMVTPIYNEPACSNAACHAHPESQNVLGVLDVGLDMKLVDQQVRRIEIRTALFTSLAVLLVGVCAAAFTRRFVTTPLTRLSEATRQVAEMKLDRPIALTSSEELEALASSFNEMRRRLALAMEELNELTRGLEEKVDERTEQLKVAQQKLMQADRLASLGQLSASVAHEINNPLSGVLNLSMLMQRILKDDGVPKGREAEFRRYLEQVVAETARTGRIVSDLLAFSRRGTPVRSETDLNVIVGRTLSLVSHKLKLMNVEVECALDAALPRVEADSSQLQQVVMNLVLNAGEATRRKGAGHLRVSTRATALKKEVVLEVRDDGEGMPPELKERIFEPFFTTKDEGKGVGLGLAVVYGIVQAHDGDIEVESAPGEGTLFRVTLPVRGEAAAPKA